VDLGAVDRHHTDSDQARLRAQHEHRAEQARERRLVTLAKAPIVE
jgi:hypothetical protein